MYDNLIDQIRQALGRRGGAMDPRAIVALIAGVHPSDLAVILDELTLPESERVFELLDDSRAAEVLPKVAAATSRHLVEGGSVARILALLRLLPVDEVAALVSAFPKGKSFLALLPGPTATSVGHLLEYSAQTAGRLMTTECATASPDASVEVAFTALRAVAATVETIANVYVVDDTTRLLGTCSIRDLLIADSQATMDSVMTRSPITVPPDMDQQEVARVIAQYDLIAVPVVDHGMHLLGIVTVDDVLDIVTDEFNEDYASLIGSDAAEMDRRTPIQVARLRLPWLIATMAIELGAGIVISRFDKVLKEVILLASFMPVISAVSGNVGLQAAAIVVRGLDTGHVSLRHWTNTVRRELATALAIAGVAGMTLALVATLWSRHLPFGLVVGVAMICAIVTAGVMGTVIPMLSKRLGFDPATTAGPFETAFQDVVGFTVFLWLAARLSRWLV